MAIQRICDRCGEVAEIVAQLYLTPIPQGTPAGFKHVSSYKARMDIGMCCIVAVRDLGAWRARRTKEQMGEELKVRRVKSA